MKISTLVCLIIGLIAILLLIIFVVPRGRETKEPFKIGVILPLTGEVSYIGENIQKGIDLAKDSTDMGIDLIYEDGRCSGRESVTAAQKLLNIDKVDALLGPVCVTAGKSIAPILQDADIPVIGITPSKNFPYAGDNVFTTLLTTERYATKLADYASQNYDEMALLYTIDEGQKEGSLTMQKLFKKRGGQTLYSEGINPQDTDLRTAALKVKDAEPEVYFNALLIDHTISLLKSFQEMDYKVDIMGYADPFATARKQLEEALGKEALKGIVFVDEVSTTEGKDISQAFTEKFNQDVNLLNKWGYDAGLILFDAFQNTAGDNEAVVDYINGLQNWQGASGTINFDQDGVIQKELGIFQISQDGDRRVDK